MTMYDNIWTNTKEYANYANMPPTLVRNYPTAPIDSRLNFPPKDSYQDRLVGLIDREPAHGWIDVDIYRITLARPVDALIRAASRGVRIRMYLEPNEYATRLVRATRCRWIAWSPPLSSIPERLRSACASTRG